MPERVRDELQARLRPYRRRHPEARWTRPESWHLTLLFLARVRPDRAAELIALVDQLADALEPYEIAIGHGGGRVRNGTGVAWLALTTGAGTLIGAARALAERCPLDITEEGAPKRTPSAHLTVARRADEGLIAALAASRHGPLELSWTVDRVDLLQSHLEPGGARYVTLHRAAL